MFRVITIKKLHQTTRFRRYHTQQANKQRVSNEPVAINVELTLTFTQPNVFPNSFSNDSTSIDSFLTIFGTLLQTAFRKILTIFLIAEFILETENRLRRETRHKTENSSNVNPGCDEFPVSIYPSNFPNQTDGNVGRETRQRRKSILNSY